MAATKVRFQHRGDAFVLELYDNGRYRLFAGTHDYGCGTWGSDGLHPGDAKHRAIVGLLPAAEVALSEAVSDGDVDLLDT